MRIKLDENLGLRTAGLFSEADHDVATVYDQQLTSAPDAELFATCSREGRVLVTLDLDFADPFRFDPFTSAGIAVLRVPDLPGREDLMDAARTLVAHLRQADIAGHLWIVERRRVRQYEPDQGPG